MAALIDRVGALRESGVLGQLIRFGIVGGFSTILYAIVYLPLAYWVFPGLAVAAVPFAFAVAVTFGYFAHSAWSFRGHGTREKGGRQQLKFVVVQGFGLLLNALFTWVIADVLHQPDWAPLIPVVIVTPIATFWLNRQWVFG